MIRETEEIGKAAEMWLRISTSQQLSSEQFVAEHALQFFSLKPSFAFNARFVEISHTGKEVRAFHLTQRQSLRFLLCAIEPIPKSTIIKLVQAYPLWHKYPTNHNSRFTSICGSMRTSKISALIARFNTLSAASAVMTAIVTLPLLYVFLSVAKIFLVTK